MSDFLSSLRAASTGVFNDKGGQSARRVNDSIRQSPEYAAAAGAYTGGPGSLSGFSLAEDYSPAAIARYSSAAQTFAGDVSADKGLIDNARDTTLNVASGLVGGALNLVALGGSGFAAAERLKGNNVYDIGVPVGRFAERTTEFLGNLRTQEARDAATAYGVTQDILTGDNRQAEQEAVAAGANPLMAGAERIFNDVRDTGANLFNNPEALGQGTAQGVGSLLLGGPVAKGATSVVSGGARALAARGLLSNRAASVVAESVERAAMTGSIAAMEAGGAYTQASGVVMGMSHDDLMENSPQYAQLIQEGMSPDNAKNQIASRAGSVAAAIQAPIAAATGRMVAGFEAAPLAGTTVRGALQNIGKETIEEGIQSFSGGLASNLGVRASGDVTQDLGEGLGSGLAEGAIFGAGTAGVFAGPSVAVGTAQRTAAGARRLAGQITERGRQINEANVIKPAQAAAAVKTAAQPVQPTNMDPEVQANFSELSSLAEQFHFDPTTYTPTSRGEVTLLSSLDPNAQYDIWDVMTRGSELISNPDVSNEDKTDMALMLFGLYSGVTDEAISQVADLQGKATPGGVMAGELNRIIAGQEAISNNPLILKALQDGLNATPDVTVDQVEDISTPEGQRAAQKVAAQALFSPETIAPEVAERLVRHSSARPDLFTGSQQMALRSTAALTKTVQGMAADAERMGVKAPALAEVANQAQMYNDKEAGFAGPSVRGHYAAIQGLMAQGATQEAAEALESFQSFAQSMANKLAAINASHTSRANRRNEPQTFDAYSQTTGWHKSKPLTVISQNAGSVAFAQQAGVDASFVVDAFNNLVDQFPDLGGQKVQRESLNSDLTAGPAREVAEQTKLRDAGPAPQEPANKPDTKPAETQSQPEQTSAKEPATAEPATPPVQEEPEQLELPLTAERVRKAQSEGINRQIALIEDRRDFGTPLPNDAVNLKVLKAERDAREEALLTEPSVLVEDTKTQPTPEVVEEVAEPEAQPEVQATETTAENEKKTPEMTEVFPDLMADTNGDQLLINGFSLDNAARTRLIGEDAVTIPEVQEALSSPEAFQALTGFGRYKLTPQVSAAYTQTMNAVLSRVFPEMEARMKSSKHFKPYLDGTQPGNAIRSVNLRLLNLMQFNGKELVFADKIGEAATLALTDWLAQNSIAGPQRSDEDIARKLRIDINDVTNELRLAYNSSITSQQAHDTLAQTLTQHLGLKPKNDVKNGFTDGLMMSLAGELLDAAEAVGFVTATDPIQVGDSRVVFMKTNRDGLGLSGQEPDSPSFAGQTTLISQIIQQDESIAGYTLNAPSGNRLSKLQGGGAPTTAAQNKAANVENAIPQTVNRPVLDLYRHLGLDGIVDLFGNGQLDETLNKNDREAKEGQNLAFVSAFETVMGLVTEMEAAAVETNAELEEIKLYREYAFSSVNRMQQQGQYGDQSSKLVREMITPYATTLDMTNPADVTMWRRGIAQALGVKVEKLRQENWEAQLDKMLADPAIQSAIAMLADPSATPSDQLIAGLKAGLDPKGNKGVTPVQVHALKSYAEFLGNDDPQAFFTHVYVEADGVTDGPTNSLIYMRTGGFDVEMVRGLARGGLMFSEAPVALHQIFDPEVGDVLPDTYEISGQRLSEGLSTHINNAIATGENAAQQEALTHQSEALMMAMRVLLGGEGFSYIDNVDGTRTYTIGRKQLKNPLTVTVYGSSPAGIAAKIAKEMTRLIHAEVSAANKKAKEAGTKDWHQFMFEGSDNRDILIGSLAQLARNETKVFRNKVTGLVEYRVTPNNNQQVIQNYNSAVDFTVSPNAVKGLTQALQAFYVTPMVTAINQGMGSSVNGSRLIQGATNFLSVLARNAYVSAIQKALAAEVANGGRLADGLSPDTLKTILSQVAFLFPYMEDGSITVNVKGLSKGLMSGPGGSEARTAATFKNQMPTQLTIPMPAVAGVAGAAYVNISYGDGRMIIEASPNLVGGRLMVFDGINLALKDAQRNGVAINKTVLDALQSGTPFADLAKTFSTMRETIGLDAFSDAEMASIVRDLTPPGMALDVTNAEFVQSEMQKLQSELDSAVLDEKARQNVLKRVHLSSDHMAALAAPASTSADASREDLSKLTDEDKAHRLEALFREEKAKLVNAKKAPAPKEDLSTLAAAMQADASGARVTTTSELGPKIEALNIPTSQKALIRRALAALADTNWKVVLGSQEQANAYAKSNNVPFTFGEGDMGVADMANKVMIITNLSSETLAHELIHAATLDRVTAYYADPASLDAISHDAIQRLHSLMVEWLSVSYEAAALRNVDTRKAVADAIVTVSNLINDGKPGEALNEFMAWNLANQHLVKLNSGIKVESKLARVARGVLDGLKKLFGFPSTDMASNIRFNSMVLMRDGMPSLAAQTADRILRQTSRARADLRELAEKFTNMLRTVDAPYVGSKGATPGELALQVGYQLAHTVSMNGFPLSSEERSAFARIVAAYRVNAVADPTLNTQMDILMREVQEQLNQSVMMDDPDSQDPGELQLASDRINLLNGSVDVGTDVSGRSLLVPMFVALGATSATAQGLLNRVEIRSRKAAAPGTTADTWLRGKASSFIDKMMDYSYGLRPNQKVADQIQSLVAAAIAEQDAIKGQLTQALEAPANFVREANEVGTKVIGKGIDLVSDGLDFAAAQARGTKAEAFAQRGVKVAQTALNLFHKDKAADATSTIFSKINETDIPQELRAMWGELLGVTDDNVDVLQLVKVVRSTIHRIRQTYRKLLPQQIADQFSEKVTDVQWNDIHRGLGQADASVLLDQGLSAGGVIDLFANPKEAKRLLDQKEADIRRLFPNAQDILTDAADLAALMLSGAPAHGFVRRNALAIANRAGTATVGNHAQDSAEVRAVDGYVSLLAMSQLGDKTLNSLSALATRDREAMAYTLSQIAQARRGEMAQVPDRLRFNVPKGYMPYERKGTMKAVSPSQLNDLTKAGYRVVGRRERGPAEALYDARSSDRIYVASDVAAPSFKQGIMQTVRSTVFGLDAATGLSYDNPTAGMISDPVVVKRLTAALQKGRQKENLAPLFNEQGQVYAYERLVDRADVDGSIETQRNAAVAVGHWMGRQFEETQSATLNEVLIKRLTDRWDAAANRGSQDEFVDLFELAQTDPVVADAVNLINLRDRNAILDKMGGKFMVERSLYEQVIGYRSISVGDLWTGNTRLGKENREAVANFLTGLLGAEAFRRLTVAEQGWQNLMGDARVAIVVKSMLVPAMNAIANFFQLMANGIGPVEIAKKSAEKLRETHLYAQNHLKYQGLEADLAAAKGAKRPDRIRQIETEMRKIEDLNKRLSIWPLIQAGEFTQVTEGLTQDDLEMTRGRVWDHVSKLADKLPPAVKTAGRYAVVAKDTALFEGLARTVAYTDFVAKAVLHDHLKNREKLSDREVLVRQTNEFVNYDLLGGRMRSKAEEMGLIWFWAFKLRSIKVAVSMLRNNPLHALLTGMAPGVDIGGTVIDDNMLSLFTDGRWDNSLGPDNALRGLALNPLAQML